MMSNKLKILTILLLSLAALLYFELRALRDLRLDDTWDKSDNLNVSQYIDQAHAIMQPDLQNMRSILIFVSSSASNRKKRQDIRDSWAREVSGAGMSVIFHVGVLRHSNEESEAELSREHEQHRDILQNSLVDNYQNLTLKSAFMLSWAQRLSSERNVTHIVKVDDDIWLNVTRLQIFLREADEDSREYLRNSIYGYVNSYYLEVARPGSETNKNQVPKWMYPGQDFPPYVLGSLYIIPARLLGCLVSRTSEVGFISVEDVYVTGLLRSRCQDIELTFVPGSSPDPLTCSEMTSERMLLMATGNQSVQMGHECKRTGAERHE